MFTFVSAGWTSVKDNGGWSLLARFLSFQFFYTKYLFVVIQSSHKLALIFMYFSHFLSHSFDLPVTWQYALHVANIQKLVLINDALKYLTWLYSSLMLNCESMAE